MVSLSNHERNRIIQNIPSALRACTAALTVLRHMPHSSGPAWLVTGDKDLLVLADALSALGVRILAPTEALALREFSPN